MGTAPLTDLQIALTFFLLKISPTMYILRKSSDFELFEKQHHGTPKSNKNNKNNTLPSIPVLEKCLWVLILWGYQKVFRTNVRHFFWKGFRGQKRCFKHLAHFFGQKSAILDIYIYKKIFSEVEKSEKIDFSKNAPYYF